MRGSGYYSWDDTHTIQIELSFDGWYANATVGRWYLDIQDLTNEQQLPEEIANLIHSALIRQYLTGDEIFDEIPADIFITFRASGYYDPGYTSGPPDQCYPPDSCDDRELVEIYLEYGDDSVRINFTAEEQQQLFAHFENAVNEYELS